MKIALTEEMRRIDKMAAEMFGIDALLLMENAGRAAADALLKTGKPFEINTGAMARGVKSGAYPSVEIIEYLGSRGGRFILAGDSHRKEDLCFGFEKYEAYVR